MIRFKAWFLIGYTSKWRLEKISIITWGTYDYRNHLRMKACSPCALGGSDSHLWIRAWSDYHRPLAGDLKATLTSILPAYNLIFLHVQSHYKWRPSSLIPACSLSLFSLLFSIQNCPLSPLRQSMVNHLTCILCISPLLTLLLVLTKSCLVCDT